jgi:hypothetical protein
MSERYAVASSAIARLLRVKNPESVSRSGGGVLYYLQDHHRRKPVATTAQAYGVEATLTDAALHLRATSKMGRVALFGPDPRDAVDVPLEEIASARHTPPPKWALRFINGHLDVRTTAGTRYQVHYRASKNREFGPLADAVVAAVQR